MSWRGQPGKAGPLEIQSYAGAQFLLVYHGMDTGFHTHNLGKKMPNRDAIDNLRRALDLGYARMRERARSEWERNVAGKDPSDACVSIRITTGDSRGRSLPTAGVLRRRPSLLAGGGRPLLA